MNSYSTYENKDKIEAAVSNGGHRAIIGGMWDEIGKLQFEMMVDRGLQKGHRLLDIGCGSLRGGIHFIKYLDPNHYYGLDLNKALIDAGYEKEIVPAGLENRIERSQLIDDAEFDFARFGVEFDRAIAISVFTHMPLDLARICLEKLAPVVRPGGTFFATFFEIPDDQPTYKAQSQKGGITTHAGRDPFHHRASDFQFLCSGLPWEVKYIGDFAHPRGQQLISFVRR